MFFYYYLSAPHVQSFIKIISTRTSQSDLTHREFSLLTVFIPSLEEQRKIASILMLIDNEVRTYTQHKVYLQNLKKGLSQKLLTGKIRVKV
jgi:type I restriction enzyme S subunit